MRNQAFLIGEKPFPIGNFGPYDVEERDAESEPLEQAVLDAGIMRLRPVLIIFGATVSVPSRPSRWVCLSPFKSPTGCQDQLSEGR